MIIAIYTMEDVIEDLSRVNVFVRKNVKFQARAEYKKYRVFNICFEDWAIVTPVDDIVEYKDKILLKDGTKKIWFNKRFVSRIIEETNE